MTPPTPAWIRRFRAARVRLPSWALDAPSRTTYATNATGVWQLSSWDLDADVHTPLTEKPTGVIAGGLLPDGSGLVWFDDHAGDEVGRHVVTPFAGGPPQPLVPDVAEGWSSGLSLRTALLAVGVADRSGHRIATGTREATRTVYEASSPAWVGGLSRDAALLAVVHTEHGDVLHPALKLLSAADGEVVAELWDGRGNTIVAAGWSPIRGDARVALVADRSGRNRPEVYDAASGTREALDLDLPGEVSVADWYPDGGALLLAHDSRGRTELHRYDLDEGRAERLDLPPGTIAGASVRDDGALWYAFTSSSAPSQVRVRDASGDRVLLTPPGEPAPAGAAYTSVDYDNGEGGTVHAFLATPPSVPSGPVAPFPLVVDVHGGPQAQTEDAFDAHVQSWVDHGFAVLMPNYRGSTGYGKAWADALEGDPGRPELVDCLAGVRALASQGVVDPQRSVLEGASWGGYVTLQGLGTQPEAWACGVAVVPVADYIAAYADESPDLQQFDASLFGGTPEELPELYAERSPITHADRVRAPVVIITGRNDTRCPLRQVENYVAALRERGATVDLDVFDAGHGSFAVEETIRQQALSIDFVARHLGTPVAQR